MVACNACSWLTVRAQVAACTMRHSSVGGCAAHRVQGYRLGLGGLTTGHSTLHAQRTASLEHVIARKLTASHSRPAWLKGPAGEGTEWPRPCNEGLHQGAKTS